MFTILILLKERSYIIKHNPFPEIILSMVNSIKYFKRDINDILSVILNQ